jgi:NitT/TauT family transport system substrate-binding protein
LDGETYKFGLSDTHQGALIRVLGEIGFSYAPLSTRGDAVRVPVKILTLSILLALAVVSDRSNANDIKLKVASTSRQVFDNLPLFVGKDAGIFKKYGLDVEITHFSGGGEVVRAVSSGSMQLGMVSASSAIIAAAAGQNLKIISAWSAPEYGTYYIVPANSPIKSATQLDGKKIGVSRPGSVSHTGLLTAARALQIRVEPVPVGSPGDSWIAMKTGRVDAGWHVVPDVYGLFDRGEARIVIKAEDFLKDYQRGVLIAMNDYLGNNPDATRRFIRASAEAIEFINKNSSAAAKIGAQGAGYSEEATLRAIEGMPKDFFRVGVVPPKNFSGALDEALGTGILKATMAYDAIIDRAYLP